MGQLFIQVSSFSFKICASLAVFIIGLSNRQVIINRELMSLQSQVTQLILQNSPQLQVLRCRAITGNHQYLQIFCNSICQLLKNPSTHSAAYREINQLFLSADPQIIAHLDSCVFGQVQKHHEKDDLADYIKLWKTVTHRDPRYPDLSHRLKNIRLPQSATQFQVIFQEFQRQFANNANRHFQHAVQFFDVSPISSSTLTIQAQDVGSEIVADYIKQMREIRMITQSSHIPQSKAKIYYQRALKFLSCSPASLEYELSLDFNNERIWAKQFVEKFQNFNEGDSFAVRRLPPQSQTDRQLKLPFGLQPRRKDIEFHGNTERQKWTEQKKSGGKRSLYPPNPNYETVKIQMNEQHQKIDEQPVPKHHRKLNPLKQKEGNSIIRPGKNSGHPNPNLASSGGAYQSQTIPYDQTNFNHKYVYPSNINYNRQGSISSLRIKPLVSSQSQQNLIHSSKSRDRPKIFGTKTIKLNSHGEKQDILKWGKQEENNQNINQRDEDLQVYDRHHGFAQFMYNASPRLTFLTDGTPYSSSDRNQRLTLPGLTLNKGGPQIVKKSGEFTNFNWEGSKKIIGSQNLRLTSYNEQKLRRYQRVAEEQFPKLQNEILEPYAKNFIDKDSFSQFKKKCLRDSSIAWQSKDLAISYQTQRISDTKAKVSISFINKGGKKFIMHTLYRIPTCMKFQQTRIHRNWILERSHNHTFTLELLSFPLQPCYLNFYYNHLSQFEGFEPSDILVITLPLTIRNYMHFLVINQNQWDEKWSAWQKQGNTHISRNIRVDQKVFGELQKLQSVIELQPTSDFSVQEVGSFCCQQSLSSIYFLLKSSQRTQNAATLELLASRNVNEQDELDYLIYCFDLWSLLLARTDWHHES